MEERPKNTLKTVTLAAAALTTLAFAAPAYADEIRGWNTHALQVVVTGCGRICMDRKKINLSTVMAGQKLGIKEMDNGSWLVSFMAYDLGYMDLEQKTLQTIDTPFGTRLSPMSQEHSVTYVSGMDTQEPWRRG